MDEQDAIFNKPAPSKVQMHQLKPIANGMSFGALLDKFYMNSELGKEMAVQKDNAEVKAQDFIISAKKAAAK